MIPGENWKKASIKKRKTQETPCDNKITPMKSLAFIFIFLSFFQSIAHAVDLAQIEAELKGAGATGWIHGSVESQNLYVFTYRNPANFFDYVEMSLTTKDQAIQKKFASLARHDQVVVKGSFLDIKVPQKHIDVTSIDLIKKYQSSEAVDPYQHQVKIPDELLNVNSATFLVHAVAAEGQILVVEYKDAILPIFVKNGALAKDLYRGDLVQLSFKIRKDPDQPVHLKLNEADPKAIQVLESIRALDQKPASVQGALILFPKSPEISLNVFSVEQTLPAGLRRQFTLVNFDNPEVFNQIIQKCQKAWDQHPGEYVNGRNKLVSNRLQVKVIGTFNEVSPSQANAQVLIKSIDDLQIIDTKDGSIIK